MAKKIHNYKFSNAKKSKRTREVKYLLEQGTLESIRAAKERTQRLIDYYWQYYSELAQQRNQKIENIRAALLESCASDFEFNNWQRTVKYKYSLHPLSTIGSLSFIGGRFNTGNDVNVNVPVHPALYLAVDKETCLQEALSQQGGQHSEFTPLEIALTNKESYAMVSVSGKLEKIFDLRSTKSLKQIVGVMKEFKLSDDLFKKAIELGIEKPDIIRSNKQLLDSLLDKNWRHLPTNLEVPSNSQIFGHLLFNSGIEGVIYPSKFTQKDCIAAFPKNFDGGGSYIKIEGDVPHKKVPNKIDGTSWRLCDISFDEISGEGVESH